MFKNKYHRHGLRELKKMVSKNTGEPEAIPAEIAQMSFEDALNALEVIVKSLEGGQVSLEDSIDIYTRGTALRQHCDNKLKDASARIEKITKSPDGSLGVTALDAG